MKKIFALLLVPIIALSLVACGDNEETDIGSQNGTSSTASNSNDDKGTSSADDKPTFDTAWATNDFEALLPELPFTEWTTSQPDANTYKMEKIGLNTSAATNPPDSDEPDGADKQKLKDYLATLSSYSFTVEETGADYQWLVKDTVGNEAEFMVGDGGCWITIKKAN